MSGDPEKAKEALAAWRRAHNELQEAYSAEETARVQLGNAFGHSVLIGDNGEISLAISPERLLGYTEQIHTLACERDDAKRALRKASGGGVGVDGPQLR